MRSLELKKAGETAMAKRLRHKQTTCHLVSDLIMYCGEDEDMARAIGERVITGVLWAYTGRHGDHPDEQRQALQQRLITTQLVAYLCANAAGREDAQEIGRLLLRGIDWVYSEAYDRDLRLVVC